MFLQAAFSSILEERLKKEQEMEEKKQWWRNIHDLENEDGCF